MRYRSDLFNVALTMLRRREHKQIEELPERLTELLSGAESDVDVCDGAFVSRQAIAALVSQYVVERDLIERMREMYRALKNDEHWEV